MCYHCAELMVQNLDFNRNHQQFLQSLVVKLGTTECLSGPGTKNNNNNNNNNKKQLSDKEKVSPLAPYLCASITWVR